MYRTVQACIRFQQEHDAEMFTSVECHGVQPQLSLSVLLGIPTNVIDKIIGRELFTGQVREI
jgi:hypothetical protein